MTLHTLLVGSGIVLCVLLAAVAVGEKTSSETAPRYSRDIPADPPPPPTRFRKVQPTLKPLDEATIAMDRAEASEADYRSAVEANKQQPGKIADAEIERLYRVYSENMLAALRKRVESQQDQINQLRVAQFRLLSGREDQ
jgi:hypothetical protein